MTTDSRRQITKMLLTTQPVYLRHLVIFTYGYIILLSSNYAWTLPDVTTFTSKTDYTMIFYDDGICKALWCLFQPLLNQTKLIYTRITGVHRFPSSIYIYVQIKLAAKGSSDLASPGRSKWNYTFFYRISWICSNRVLSCSLTSDTNITWTALNIIFGHCQ